MNIRRSLFLFVVLILGVAFVAQPASAQKYLEDVQKWDAYGGYTHLIISSPTVKMSQYGYNLSFGRNINKWLALGFDFSNFNGTDGISASGGDLAVRLPASVASQIPPIFLQPLAATTFKVPFDASTTTFAAGTQFQLRKTKWVTPFFRPFLGAFHSKVEGKAQQIAVTALPTQLPTGVTPAVYQAFLQQLQASIPADQKMTLGDATVMGYGVGSGVDLNLTKPIGVRMAFDYIRTPLNHERQNNFRFGFGLIYRFGGPALVKK